VLLLPSFDRERSFSITSAREGRPWTGVYPAYQKVLHEILLHQADEGAYDLVLDCENRSRADVHDRILAGTGSHRMIETLHEGDDR
jgi:hypothetical protein